MFLRHFPWGRPHQQLTGIPSCGARTFLPLAIAGDRLDRSDAATHKPRGTKLQAFVWRAPRIWRYERAVRSVMPCA